MLRHRNEGICKPKLKKKAQSNVMSLQAICVKKKKFKNNLNEYASDLSFTKCKCEIMEADPKSFYYYYYEIFSLLDTRLNLTESMSLPFSSGLHHLKRYCISIKSES